MIELLLLYGLGCLHAGLAGFREAAGRNLRIHKRRYFLRATLRGLGLGQLAALVILAVIGLQLIEADDPWGQLDRIGCASRPGLAVYLGYTALVGLTFVGYAIPYVEVRSLATVAIFGPLTLLLPWVMVLGGGLTVLWTPRPGLAALHAVAVGLMLTIEPALSRAGWSRAEAERCIG